MISSPYARGSATTSPGVGRRGMDRSNGYS